MAGRTEHIYLQGKAKWCKITAPDPWGNWKITLYPTPESLDKFKALGVKNHLKRDEDGDNVTFRRPSQKIIRGKTVGFSPPLVIDSNGIPLEGVLIGNGSDVTVKLDYYGFKTPIGDTGKAVRLASIRVDNLVPFKPEADYTEDQIKAVAKLREQPQQEELF